MVEAPGLLLAEQDIITAPLQRCLLIYGEKSLAEVRRTQQNGKLKTRQSRFQNYPGAGARPTFRMAHLSPPAFNPTARMAKMSMYERTVMTVYPGTVSRMYKKILLGTVAATDEIEILSGTTLTGSQSEASEGARKHSQAVANDFAPNGHDTHCSFS